MTRLRRLREQTGLSAYAFAANIGISDVYYRSLEAGRSQPGAEKLRAIVEGLARTLERDPGEIAAELLELEPA